MLKILITGGLGNIGTATMQELSSRGHEIRCVNLSTARQMQRAKKLALKNVTYVWGDITDYETVLQAVSGQDIIIHLAAILPPFSDEDPTRAEKVNVGGIQNILKAAASQDHPPKLFFRETMADIDRATASPTVSKIFIWAARPLLRRWILSFSPYYKKAKKSQKVAVEF